MWIVDERLILHQPGLLKLMIYVLTFHITLALRINTSSQSGGRKDDSRPNFVFLCLLNLPLMSFNFLNLLLKASAFIVSTPIAELSHFPGILNQVLGSAVRRALHLRGFGHAFNISDGAHGSGTSPCILWSRFDDDRHSQC
jgi:hypothetical protein